MRVTRRRDHRIAPASPWDEFFRESDPSLGSTRLTLLRATWTRMASILARIVFFVLRELKSGKSRCDAITSIGE
jgi:hypothetical protein